MLHLGRGGGERREGVEDTSASSEDYKHKDTLVVTT